MGQREETRTQPTALATRSRRCRRLPPAEPAGGDAGAARPDSSPPAGRPAPGAAPWGLRGTRSPGSFGAPLAGVGAARGGGRRRRSPLSQWHDGAGRPGASAQGLNAPASPAAGASASEAARASEWVRPPAAPGRVLVARAGRGARDSLTRRGQRAPWRRAPERVREGWRGRCPARLGTPGQLLPVHPPLPSGERGVQAQGPAPRISGG
ncbi:Hypothetical predicted protein [Marmota monax]|uniref:Uncharacterized protein n=1 Tax=Marmota monax TaxID=9995 RepID=A0A5E4BTF0_MARMO|nr:Hypothetical predicted protein [Marmota monax]